MASIPPLTSRLIYDQRANAGITVGFSTTNKLGSRIIRFITRSIVSHTWIAFYDATLQQRMVIQAEIWGYEVRPWNRWLLENKWVAEYALPVLDTTDAALQCTASMLGCDYDFTSVFAIALRRWFKRLWKKPWQSPRKLMCSEGVVRFLQTAGYIFAEQLHPELTTPQSLLETLEAYGIFGLYKIKKLENP